MKKFIIPGAGAVGLLLAACLTAPGEPSDPKGSTSDALSCGANQRPFNGACRQTCTTSAQCGAPNTCMNVGGGEHLCIDSAACAYLGDDTECNDVSVGTSYGYAYGNQRHCVGNATWQVAPPRATDDVKCTTVHAATRCQLQNESIDMNPSAARCKLVPSFAGEMADQGTR